MGALISKKLVTDLLKTEGIDLATICTGAKGNIGTQVDNKVNQIIPKIEAQIDPIVGNVQLLTPKYLKIASIAVIVYFVLFLILFLMQVIAFIIVIRR